MESRSFRIGHMARLTGVPVRRIRFYSDKGLLPATGRTSNNYRVYTDNDVARLNLICALRVAGIEIATIAKVLENRLLLRQVLSSRLALLEAELDTKSNVAAALRATLAADEISYEALGRLWKTMMVSVEQMKRRVNEFISYVIAGLPEDHERELVASWHRLEVEEQPSRDQSKAWNGLYELMGDDGVRRAIRAQINLAYAAIPPERRMAYVTGGLSELADQERSLYVSGVAHDAPEVLEIQGKILAYEARARGRKPAAVYRHMQEARGDDKLDRFLDYLHTLKGIGRPQDKEEWKFVEWRRRAFAVLEDHEQFRGHNT